MVNFSFFSMSSLLKAEMLIFIIVEREGEKGGGEGEEEKTVESECH
jgi:hypothetical protein